MPDKIMGLTISIYRTAHLGDCTNGGVSATADEALVIGDGIDGISEAHGRPVLRLVKHGTMKIAYLVPVGLENKWTMFGGNFGFCSDSRFRQAVGKICGYQFHGAVPIHDRVEG